MAIWTVADTGTAAGNGAAVNAVLANVGFASGDTIRLAATTVDYEVGPINLPNLKDVIFDCLTGGTAVTDPIGDGSTWAPFTHYAANLAGYIGANATVHLKNVGLHSPAGDWPNIAGGQTWAQFIAAKYGGGADARWLLYGNDRSNPATVLVEGVEMWVGFGGTGAAFGVNGADITTGVAYDNATLDALDAAPSAIGGFVKSVQHLGAVWIHDASHGIVPAYVGDGSDPGFLLNHASGHVIERCYADFLQVVVDPTATGGPALKRAFFLYRDAIGSGFDPPAEHVDFGQHDSSVVSNVLTGGSGYTNGTHTDALLTGAAITIKAQITVALGVVTACDLLDSNGKATAGAIPFNTDIVPLNSAQIGAGTGFKLRRGSPIVCFEYEVNNGLCYQSPTCRDQPQGPAFYQGGGDHGDVNGVVYRAMKVRNVMGSGTSRFLSVAGAEDLYLRNSTGVNPAAWGPPALNAAYLDVTVKQANWWATPTKLLRKGLIFEGYAAADGVSQGTWKSVDNFDAPVQATAYVDPTTVPTQTNARTPANASQVYSRLRTQGAYVAAGPQYTTLRAMLADNSGWAGEYPHLSFLDVWGQEISTGTNKVTSALSYVHGGNVGDVLSLTLPAGLEGQVYDTDKTTVLTPWTTGLTTATVGKYLQVRALPPGAYAASSVFNIVLNSVTIPWTINTRSNLAFPRVTKPNTNNVERTSAGAFAASGSKKGMAFFEIMIPSGQTLGINTYVILQGGAGRNFSMGLGSDGTSWSCNLTFTDSSGAAVATAAYTALSCDTWYRIWLMVDTSLATSELAVLSQALSLADYTMPPPPVLSYNKDALIAWNFAHASNAGLILPIAAGGYGLVALVAGEAFTAFPSFTPEHVGAQGQGLSPTGRQIELFLPGEVIPNNRGITSMPGGGVWALDTGSLTPSGGGVWPPPTTVLSGARMRMRGR